MHSQTGLGPATLGYETVSPAELLQATFGTKHAVSMGA